MKASEALELPVLAPMLGAVASIVSAAYADERGLWIAFAIILAAVSLAVVLKPKSRFASLKSIRLDPSNPNDLFERNKDLDRFFGLCHHCNTVILTGESGIGKSALIRGGVVHSEEAKAFIPVIVDDWKGARDEGALDRKIRTAVFKSLHEGESQSGLLAEMQAILAKRSRAKFLLIFDQFEDYILELMRDISHNDLAAMSREQLTAAHGEWTLVEELVHSGVATVVFIVNRDFYFCIKPFGFGGRVESMELRRIEAGTAIREYFGRLSDPHRLSNEIITPEGGWHKLAARIVEDLDAEGPVLPAKLSFIIQSLPALPDLTERSYVRVGGIEGLERHMIATAISKCARRSRLRESMVLAILAQFIKVSDDTIMSRKLTAREVQHRLRESVGVSDDAKGITGAGLKAVIQEFNGYGILVAAAAVKKDVQNDGRRRRYRIKHDYICKAIWAHLQRVNLDLSLRHRAYERQTGLLARWGHLLSPSAQVKIWIDRVRGKMEFGQYRNYVLMSLVRWAPYQLLFIVLADLDLRFPGSGYVRDALDFCNVSLFRTVASEDLIEENRAAIEQEAWRELTHRARADAPSGWKSAPESWGSGQIVFAVACGLSRDDQELTKVVHSDLRSLHSDVLLQRSKDGKPYGWARGARFDETIGMSTMWIGAAVNRYAKTSGSDSAEVEMWLDFADAAEDRLWNERAWTFYPDQGGFQIGDRLVDASVPDIHSTYATALGLIYMLEEYRRTQSAESVEKIKKASDWLIETHQMVPSSGWVTFPERRDSGVMLGLSLQIYATLFRLVRHFPELGIVLTPEIYLSAAQSLVQIEPGPSFSASEVDENAGIYLAHDGRLLHREVLVSYEWMPWAIDAANQWLALAEEEKFQASRIDRRRVQRVRGKLLEDQRRLHEWSVDKGVAATSELYLALSDCLAPET